jgi:hypothetical protein
VAQKDEEIDLAGPAALTHSDPVIASAAHVALWGLDTPPRIQAEGAARAKGAADSADRGRAGTECPDQEPGSPSLQIKGRDGRNRVWPLEIL